MSPPREDNYQVADVSNVTATPNITTNAINKIVINTLDKLLSSSDNTRTSTPFIIVALVFFLLFSTVGAFYAAWSESDKSENDNVQSRLN